MQIVNALPYMHRGSEEASDHLAISVLTPSLVSLFLGSPFLKYGRFGYPHFRLVQLAEDNHRLIWFSKNKSIEDTQSAYSCHFFLFFSHFCLSSLSSWSVDLTEVDEIVLGQQTSIFERHRAPELNNASFSIVYGGHKRTLDLIAKTPYDFALWTTALTKLVPMCQAPGADDLEKLSGRISHQFLISFCLCVCFILFYTFSSFGFLIC